MSKPCIFCLTVMSAVLLTNALAAQMITYIQYKDAAGVTSKPILQITKPKDLAARPQMIKLADSLRLYLSDEDKKLTEIPLGKIPGYSQNIDAKDSVAIWNKYFLQGDIVGQRYSFYVWAVSPYVYGGEGQTTTHFRADFIINKLIVATINFLSNSYSISRGTRYTVTGIDPIASKGDTVKLKVSYRGGYGGTIVWGLAPGFESYIDIPAVVPSAVNDHETQSPHHFALLQNYPNPFNPSTTISFQLQESNHIKLTIYNILGEEIRTLAVGQYQAGNHTIRWDGTDNYGNPVASGVYLYQLHAGDFLQVRKMVLAR